MKTVLRWILSRFTLFIALVLAIGFYRLIWPEIETNFSTQAIQAESLSISEVKDRIDQERDRQQARLSSSFTTIKSETKQELVDRKAASIKAKKEAQQRSTAAKEGWFAPYRPSKILDRTKADIEVAYRDKEIAVIDGVLRIRSLDDKVRDAKKALEPYRKIPTKNAVRAAARQCVDSDKALKDFNAEYARSWTKKDPGEIGQDIANYWTNKRVRLEGKKRDDCDGWREKKDKRETGIALAQTLTKAQNILARARSELQPPTLPKGFSERIAESTIRDILLQAAIALALILATPYLIRIIFYYVLAPVAERRGSIRLYVPGGGGSAIPPAARSTTSIPVRLEANEELLVRQSYLQTTSLKAAKKTQWCLNWRYPFSSLASGMIFLTRVRGDDEVTTISAVHDPLAEVTELTLPDGASCVLQPRALAAVVQPIGRPLRITRHWRLGTLNAWLTLQLRYLVFHGPARLILKGSRGVRIERAEAGRIFGQDQLIGFSADLAYSVTRTETFAPYFFGREQLLKDKVEAGQGILIIEEVPLAGGGDGRPRRGLEGAFDAVMKAFGY